MTRADLGRRLRSLRAAFLAGELLKHEYRLLRRGAALAYAELQPARKRARRAVQSALERGELVRPDRCEACGAVGGLLEAHHPDYSRPLAVIWLCPSPCHEAADRELAGGQVPLQVGRS